MGTKLGKAVVRNKVRRRLREAYRVHESKFRTGFDLVVVARVKAVHELERSLLRMAEKLGVLVKKEDKP